jgi:hypothetical protein
MAQAALDVKGSPSMQKAFSLPERRPGVTTRSDLTAGHNLEGTAIGARIEVYDAS